MGISRRFTPTLYQCGHKLGSYFEGWYFRCCQAGGGTVAFIPGINKSRGSAHAFVQYINGRTGKSAYFRYPVDAFAAQDEPFQVRVGNSTFGTKGLNLDLSDKELEIKGQVSFGPWAPYPSAFMQAGIMGPYGIPGFLECYHGLVSADHTIAGKLTIQPRIEKMSSETWDFTDGRGYAEKDWGHSFPTCYLWLQANTFPEKGLSVFCSIATIPFKGFDFLGVIAFVRQPDGTFITLASWNGARIEHLSVLDSQAQVRIAREDWKLEITGRENHTAPLMAPVHNEMQRMVKESGDANLSFILTRGGTMVASGETSSAGMERGGSAEGLISWVKK